MTRYRVRHDTTYLYREPVDMGHHVLRVTPRTGGGQRALGQTLSIRPAPAVSDSFVDHFGNVVHHVAIEEPHERFSATLEATVEVRRSSTRDAGPSWEEVRAAIDGDGLPDLPAVAEFVFASPLAPIDEAALRYAAPSFSDGRPIVDAVRALARRIHDEFLYAPNSTTVGTDVAEVLATRRGVCQDFAHAMIAGLRGLGLPARYVSGYLRTNGDRQGADASHAWVSVWCGAELGWVEIDPTNDLLVENEHIVVAYGRDFADATPLRGVLLGGGAHSLAVDVSVVRIDP